MHLFRQQAHGHADGRNGLRYIAARFRYRAGRECCSLDHAEQARDVVWVPKEWGVR